MTKKTSNSKNPKNKLNTKTKNCPLYGTPPKTDFYKNIDRVVHGIMARMTYGISPSSLSMAYWDWMTHLNYSPGKKLELLHNAIHTSARYIMSTSEAITNPEKKCLYTPIPTDHRFKDPQWQDLPFRLYYQAFLLTEA